VAFDVSVINLQYLGKIISICPREMTKLGLERLTVNPIKERKLMKVLRYYFFILLIHRICCSIEIAQEK
jgi:hypothetical protein